MIKTKFFLVSSMFRSLVPLNAVLRFYNSFPKDPGAKQ